MTEPSPISDLIGRVLIDEDQIAHHVQALADQIKRSYILAEEVVVVVVLSGAKKFADELLSCLDDNKFKVEYIKAGSYDGKTESTGRVNITEYIQTVIAGQHVLVIDDIYDSGLTLSNVVELINRGQPKSIKTCVLLEKDIPHSRQVRIDFGVLKVPDCFVVGYGLDYQGRFRNLPFVSALNLESADNSRPAC